MQLVQLRYGARALGQRTDVVDVLPSCCTEKTNITVSLINKQY